MKVTGIDTIRLERFPNLLFVEVHTDEGLVGLGETFFGARTVEAYVHETVAPYLLGRDPLTVEEHARALRGYLGYASSGAETRGNSAIDIALWDLLGHVTGQPLYQLLGGASRDDIGIYNTCAGYRYVRSLPGVEVGNWGLPAEQDEGDESGPYEDLDAFLHRADELAESLIAAQITGMKIWPFDPYAPKTSGHHISETDLQSALEPFRKIRSAVGSRMDIMVEFHGLWDLPTAKRIGRALEEFDPYWVEDPIRVENLEALADFTRSSTTQVAAGETLAGTWAYQDLLERRAADIVILDLGWVGGLTEARRIAAMADTKKLTVALHDCAGPVVLTASTHLSINLPNAVLQETVRAFYAGWYQDLVTVLPRVVGGRVAPPAGPGLGTTLLPDLRSRPGTHVQSSLLNTRGRSIEPARVGR